MAALHRAWAPDLDAATLYALLRLRAEVFVGEQASPYVDPDGRDLLPLTRHLWIEDDGRIVATARLLEDEGPEGSVFRVGRLCVARQARGRGDGARLLEAALAEVGDRPCHLAAQTYLREMYAKFGFEPAGDEYVEDGIPHIPMIRTRGYE
ncbi:GNAT family N-acetyltransferase [Tsukamurella sp. 8F]|uniref:GNAT family N-acetyltransferase n=1 Tax=unclassified Tsukamurella TaxID=2633480 RepID=UPI0023B9E7C5|nr:MULTISPECIES: GNAT family N-acetyltransferase [unclassified Tsukamurella]MDF0531600.1 GNAT family N-acetyltransferase [Tsukamurella sp. 8J]MDF0587553.1 GNAT family N-acetyltransferase [Tsukamurella sp. 8F]